MFELVTQKMKDREMNPFIQSDSVTYLQCRIYSEADRLLPEEQWSQVTVLNKGKD
jgi:hypothetical protein